MDRVNIMQAKFGTSKVFFHELKSSKLLPKVLPKLLFASYPINRCYNNMSGCVCVISSSVAYIYIFLLYSSHLFYYNRFFITSTEKGKCRFLYQTIEYYGRASKSYHMNYMNINIYLNPTIQSINICGLCVKEITTLNEWVVINRRSYI